ncbi:MAG: cation acetate symporter [Clostridiales bacterium]|nr:cation acetate symporter [Clostridiales bacterium]
MNYQPSIWAIIIFFSFVAFVLLISRYFAKRSQSTKGFYTAGGSIPWVVNGIAFAGDYLSAASFLGICGMIAFYGFDGFLYSIGYLAGWMVALFVVAEPLKRMGKYTFADALDSKFKSKGIKIAAGISTLIVSVFYLIPQMVGAGSLVTPLLGWPHWLGVILVGAVVIIIVATAGMASTTYVQFLKGALLIIFSFILVFLVLNKGLITDEYDTLEVDSAAADGISLVDTNYTVENEWTVGDHLFAAVRSADGDRTVWAYNADKGILEETLSITNKSDGSVLYNGAPEEEGKFHQVGNLTDIRGVPNTETGAVGPFEFLGIIKESTVVRWDKAIVMDDGDKITVYYQRPTSGKEVLQPGLKFPLDTTKNKLNFISLMLALFFGTAALPHILIRYYTVKNPAAARKSTIVAIVGIGFFYILTLFLGFGSMVGGALDLTNSNMSAPLLANNFSVAIFAIISAIAFATVLGTVSGLLVASSGAVVHDLVGSGKKKMSEKMEVGIGKIAAIGVGGIAIVLGILFKNLNVSYLVGWAFAVAASANLPAIIMVLFWKKTSAKGVIASIIVGLVSAMIIILLSQSTYNDVYHLVDVTAPMPIDNPAIISVPLSFLTLIVVSLMTKKKEDEAKALKNGASAKA